MRRLVPALLCLLLAACAVHKEPRFGPPAPAGDGRLHEVVVERWCAWTVVIVDERDDVTGLPDVVTRAQGAAEESATRYFYNQIGRAHV